MKHIFIFGLLLTYTLIAFQPPKGHAHPFVAILRSLDTVKGVELHLDVKESEVSSMDSVTEL